MSRKNTKLVLKQSWRVDVEEREPKLKDEINELILSEEVRTTSTIKPPFSEIETDTMITDYDRAINKADSERRLLNAARSTVFIASFGIPAIMGQFFDTGSPVFDGLGAAGLFVVGRYVSAKLSKEFRDRQLRDVAVSEYAEKKLSDLSNKKFKQLHGKRMHKELIEHLNENVDFEMFGKDKLQTASNISFYLAMGFVFTANILSLWSEENNRDASVNIENLIENIDNTVRDYFDNRTISPMGEQTPLPPR